MNDNSKLTEVLNQSTPAILPNKKIITFTGLADGTTKLTHNFPDSLLLNQKIKIDFIRFDWFTDSTIWIADAIYDNKLFTVNANTRYQLTSLSGRMKIKSPMVQSLAPAFINFLVNNFPSGLFETVSDQNLYDESWIPLNLYIPRTIKSLNWIISQTLYKDFEVGTTATPYVNVSMIIEILSTEKSKFLEVGLNSL